MLLLTLLFVGMGILLIALAIPLIQGRVKPNWYYGFRTPRTVNNPDLWYPANAYAGKLLVGFGIVVIATSVVFALIPGINEDSYSIGITILITGGLLILGYLCWKFLRTHPAAPKDNS
jgi:hypothetical protein